MTEQPATTQPDLFPLEDGIFGPEDTLNEEAANLWYADEVSRQANDPHGPNVPLYARQNDLWLLLRRYAVEMLREGPQSDPELQARLQYLDSPREGKGTDPVIGWYEVPILRRLFAYRWFMGASLHPKCTSHPMISVYDNLMITTFHSGMHELHIPDLTDAVCRFCSPGPWDRVINPDTGREYES